MGGSERLGRAPVAAHLSLCSRWSFEMAEVPERRRSNRGNICSAVNQSNVGWLMLLPLPHRRSI